ncbi:cohesin domain-containing protein [Candidatus Sumerlaeota bacterium]
MNRHSHWKTGVTASMGTAWTRLVVLCLIFAFLGLAMPSGQAAVAPDAPTNISPANGAMDVSLTPTLSASAFNDPDVGDTHAASQWQVRESSSPSSYTVTVYDLTTTDTAQLTSITLPLGTLDYATTYSWHVRYQDNNAAWSDWSAETTFTTEDLPSTMIDAGGRLYTVSEVRVNDYTADTQNWPSSAILTSDTLMISWESWYQEGAGTECYGKIYNKNGTAITGEIQLNPFNTSGWEYGPALGPLPGGGLVVSWGDSSTSVYAQLFDSAMSPIGTDFLVMNESGPWPAIGVAPNGDFVIAAAVYEPTYNVFARRYNASGVAYGARWQVNTDPLALSGHMASHPAVVVDSNGNSMVAWRKGNGDIRAQRYDSSGVVIGGEFSLNSSTVGAQYEPTIRMDGDGEYIMAWTGSGTGDSTGIWARRFSSNVLPLENEWLVNEITAGTQRRVNLAVGPSDDFVVSWSNGVTGDYDIAARLYDANGNPVGGEFRVNRYTSGGQYTVHKTGRHGAQIIGSTIFIVWYGNGPGDNDGVFMTVLRTDTPERPVNLSPANGATSVGLNPTLESSVFYSQITTATHAASRWQVREESSASDYSATVFDSGTTASALTSATIPLATLDYATTYSWRVRYQDNNGAWSAWSSETEFGTEPAIVSVSHPDSRLWYFDTTFDATWAQLDPGAAGYRWMIDPSENTAVSPGDTYTASNALSNPGVAEGTWWFHIAAVDGGGIIAGSQEDFQFNVLADAPDVSSPSHPDSNTPENATTFIAEVDFDKGRGDWTEATSAAQWSDSAGQDSVVYNGKMWVIGTYDGSYHNDVWYSEDGASWTEATSAAQWPVRGNYSSVVYDGKMWVIGGGIHNQPASTRHNDVWYSDNGTSWTEATPAAPWSPRGYHTSVVFNDKMWVIGGRDDGLHNDVWYSEDGTSWTEATSSAPWAARFCHTSVVHNGKIWVLGGWSTGSTYYNDVWYSEDGVDWTEATSAAGWSKRWYHMSVVHNGRIWVTGGGHYTDSTSYNDVWHSQDGANWTMATAAAPWGGRWAHSSVAYDDSIWVIGGGSVTGTLYADVWYLSGKPSAGVGGYYYEVDSVTDTVPTKGSAFSTTATITVPGNASGTHWFHVVGEDSLGNLSAPAHYKFIVDTPPNTPTNASPSNGATGVALTPTLSASAFSDPDVGDTHAASQWQITATSGNYGSPVYDSGTDAGNLTSVSVPGGNLAYTIVYYWHVRHQDNSANWSAWSSETQFTTLDEPNQAPNTPTNTSPANSATGVSLTPRLTASAFSDPDVGDSHATSRWQVRESASPGDWSVTVFDRTTPLYKISISLSPFYEGVSLAGATTYTWRTSHQDNNGAWSAWSVETEFTTRDVRVEDDKWVDANGSAGDAFGVSSGNAVSISGDRAIVGAQGNDDQGLGSGSAFIYELTGGVWVKKATLLASDGAEDARFGFAVSICGDTAAVGAYNFSSGLGSAYVFERIGGVWTETANLQNPGAPADDHFGRCVSISGNYLLVGAYGDDEEGASAGAAYVFERIDGTWTQVAKLTDLDGADYDMFGYSAAIAGNVAVVSSRQDDEKGNNSGTVFVFERDSGSWPQTAKLTASDGSSSDYFGHSCAVSSDTIAVGAYDHDHFSWHEGSVYVFEKVGAAWTETAELRASDIHDGELDNNLGVQVSISGNVIVAGSWYDNDRGLHSGSVYAFERDGGAWTEIEKMLASDGVSYDQLGECVSVAGNTVLAGASDDDKGDGAGAVYLYDLALSNPVNVAPDRPLNVTPTNGTTGLSLTPTLEAYAFGDPNAGDTHAASQWQITATSGDYASPAFDSGTDAGNLTSIAVPGGNLAYATTYYWHVRHQDNNGAWSGWSGETEFTTLDELNQAPNTPVNTLPASGATGVSLTPTLTSTAFSDPNVGDTHAASQWQITATSGNYGSPLYDSGTDASNLTSVDVPGGNLGSTTVYYWHVRHQDNSGSWSAWSSETPFTTLFEPNYPPSAPNGVSPSYTATSISLTPTLTSTAFSDLNAGDTHAASQWQLRVAASPADYSTTVYDSEQTTASLTGCPVPAGRLNYLTTYYWRVRHQDDRGLWSGWSSEWSFTTLEEPGGGANTAPNAPTNQGPTDGQGGVAVTPRLMASAFDDADAGDFQTASQWRIRISGSSYALGPYDSGIVAGGATEHQVPGAALAGGVTHYWQARYRDSRDAWSEWSSQTSFTTNNTGSLATPEDLRAAAGAKSVWLTWMLHRSYLVKSYNVYRATSVAGPWYPAAASVHFQNEYLDENLTPGTVYYYRLSAVATDGRESVMTEPVPALVGATRIFMTNVRGNPGDTVSQMLTINNPNQVANDGLQLEVLYDPTMLTPTAMNKTILTEDFSLSENLATANGHIIIAGTGSGVVIRGEGHVLELQYLVDGAAGPWDRSDLSFDYVELVDDSVPPHAIDIDHSSSATMTVAAPILLGDLDGSGRRTIIDELYLRQIVLAELVPTEYQQEAGDINGDHLLDSADVVLIRRIIMGYARPRGLAGRSGGYPSVVSRVGTMADAAALEYNLTWGAHTLVGGVLTIPLELDSLQDVAGLDIVVNFDPSLLTLISATQGSAIGDLESWQVFEEDSQLRMVAANATPAISASGQVAVLSFTVAQEDNLSLILAKLKLSGPNGKNLARTAPVNAEHWDGEQPANVKSWWILF